MMGLPLIGFKNVCLLKYHKQLAAASSFLFCQVQLLPPKRKGEGREWGGREWGVENGKGEGGEGGRGRGE